MHFALWDVSYCALGEVMLKTTYDYLIHPDWTRLSTEFRGPLIDCFIVCGVLTFDTRANVNQDKLSFEHSSHINGSPLLPLLTCIAIRWYKNQPNLCAGTPFWAVAHELAEPESVWWRTLRPSHPFHICSNQLLKSTANYKWEDLSARLSLPPKACIKCLLVVNNWCD